MLAKGNMNSGLNQAVLRCSLRTSATWPCFTASVKSFAQFVHSQKCSIALLFKGNPKNRPPSRRISTLGQFGLAHFEIMAPIRSDSRLQRNWTRRPEEMSPAGAS